MKPAAFLQAAKWLGSFLHKGTFGLSCEELDAMLIQTEMQGEALAKLSQGLWKKPVPTSDDGADPTPDDLEQHGLLVSYHLDGIRLNQCIRMLADAERFELLIRKSLQALANLLPEVDMPIYPRECMAGMEEYFDGSW